MLTLNITNLEKLGAPSTLPDQYRKKLADFLTQFETRNQEFHHVIDDDTVLDEIETFAKKIRGKFSDIVILGIGGSALGATTLRDSLTPTYDPDQIRLHVLDNIDPDWITEMRQSLDLTKTLFLTITKSGGTPETLSQYSYFKHEIQSANLPLADHMVCITGDSGFLREQVETEGLTSFSIPENVGGRFSVLTTVGLVPAALIGINIRDLIAGARNMRDQFISKKSAENLPFQLATIQYILFQDGFTNCVLMPYAQRLKTFAYWYKQLLAESTGKINADGAHTGITPISAVGVTDQHSQVQQFMQGLNDKQFILLKQKNFAENVPIPDLGTHEKVQMLKNVDFGKLLNTELQGTADTMTENKRPNITIEFDHLDAAVLGALFFLFEGATAFLGEYLEINAFDQPGVERSKVLTREYLMK